MNAIKTVIILCLLGIFVPLSFAAEIHNAVEAGDLEQIKTLINQNQDALEAKNDAGLTPLNMAASLGNLEIVKFLLEKGADIKSGDTEGSQPIHNASVSGNLELVKFLVKNKGLRVDEKDNFEVTPLIFASSRDHLNIAKYLIEKGADVNAQSTQGWSVLLHAVVKGNLELLTLLLEKGADPNITGWNGFIPLFSAVSFGRLEVIKLLVENGADINHANEEGETPIFWARNPNTEEGLKYLIEKGAKVTQKSNFGITPLHNVATRGSINIAEVLLEKGADINAKDEDGRTPLTFASWGHRPACTEFVKFLILHGAELNPVHDGTQCDTDKKQCACPSPSTTPLHGATQSGKLDIVKTLVENGAKINILDENGFTPLNNAVTNGDMAIVEYLLDKGAFVNSKDEKFGYTNLNIASIRGYNEIAEMLMANGANIAMMDKEGKTPLDYALYHHHKNIAYLLLSKGADENKLKEHFEKPEILAETVNQGEAAIWHLGHSGWAIKTQNHFLIFDYFIREDRTAPLDSCLANGYINPEELKDLNVCVFATHSHGDHYHQEIFEWRNTIPNIEYVLCFRPRDTEEKYTFIPIHEEKIVGDIKITTIHSTDLDGGYLVEVDGVTIFHPGDHANGDEDGVNQEFSDEIDFIADKNVEIDLAFLGVRGCSIGTPESVEIGIDYTLKKLQPKVFLPMHGGDHTYVYQDFADDCSKKEYGVQFGCAKNTGDRFVYKSGKLEKM